jgi:hypothetical protein
MKNLSLNKKAITIYRKLALYYKKENKTNMRINVIFNIAKLEKNFKKMNVLILLMKKIEFKDFDTNKSKEILLKQMEDDLEQLMQ